MKLLLADEESSAKAKQLLKRLEHTANTYVIHKHLEELSLDILELAIPAYVIKIDNTIRAREKYFLLSMLQCARSHNSSLLVKEISEKLSLFQFSIDVGVEETKTHEWSSLTPEQISTIVSREYNQFYYEGRRMR